MAVRTRVRLLTPSPTGGSQTSAMSIFDNKHSRDKKKRVHTGRCLNEPWEKRKGGELLSFEGSLQKRKKKKKEDS